MRHASALLVIGGHYSFVTLLVTQSPALQEKTLKDIQDLGAEWFNGGAASGSQRGGAIFTEEPRRDRQRNLKAPLTIKAMDDDGVLRPTEAFGSKTPLRQININKYATHLRILFGAIKTAGLTVDAVE